MEGLNLMVSNREGYYAYMLRMYREDRQKREEEKKEIEDRDFQIQNLKGRVRALGSVVRKLDSDSEIWIDSDEDISMFED